MEQVGSQNTEVILIDLRFGEALEQSGHTNLTSVYEHETKGGSFYSQL